MDHSFSFFLFLLDQKHPFSMHHLEKLKPESIWSYFETICSIPRPSKKEEKISAFILEFGNNHNLETFQDGVGNILIRKPASKGKESLKSIALQSHMDMVCEKNSNIRHDFDHDPITPVIDGEWIRAEGTTLGADDGIGIATQLAILESNEIAHGPLECLFTVDEESGMTGAHGIDPGILKSSILINLDSEDEGELFIGCAGGIDTLATFRYKEAKVPSSSVAFKISITGLKGGHSGDEIDKGLGNSNKILTRILWHARQFYKSRLHTFDGGNLRNAIPREAYAIITMKEHYTSSFEQSAQTLIDDIKSEYARIDPALSITIEDTPLPATVIKPAVHRKLLQSLYACPHGVIAYSQDIPGLVETSTNLASVKFIEDNQIVVTTSQRSSVESAKKDASEQLANLFRLAGARVVQSGGYPGWKPDTNSEILQITEKSYKKLFDEEPVVRAIHAGLECGLFLQKYPGLDMISFGPTIKGAHSPDEKINIPTTQKFWDLLIDVINNIPEE